MFKKASFLERVLPSAGSGSSTSRGQANQPGYSGKIGEQGEKEHVGYHLPPKSEEERTRAGDKLLDELPGTYFEPDFDPVTAELSRLPPDVKERLLEQTVEVRTQALEVVTERLSGHVLANYDKFVDGINEVGSIESHLQSALAATKMSRQHLAQTLREVEVNIRIAQQTKRKQQLVSMLELLLQLQQAANLHAALKDAQESVEFSEAFWLCAQCLRSMDSLEGLDVSSQLSLTISRLYEETLGRLQGAFVAVCAEFNAEHYTKVLEGYVFLGNAAQLGTEVRSTFTSLASTSVTRVVSGVVRARARAAAGPGQDYSEEEEEGAQWRARGGGAAGLSSPSGAQRAMDGGASLQEIAKKLPSDAFRSCLASVLMVLFDVMASHHRMVAWHRVALEGHARELAKIQQHKHRAVEAASRADLSASTSAAAHGSSPPPAAAADAPAMGSEASGGSSGNRADSTAGLPPDGGARPDQQQQGRQGGDATTAAREATDQQQVGQGGKATTAAREATPLEQLEDLESKEAQELAWGAVLQAVAGGLAEARGLLWDEAARKVGVLLAAPAAFEGGEHFQQVLDWTKRFASVGEAFSGCESGVLRSALQRQSGNYFSAFHTANMEALNSMLDREMWKRLPPVPGFSLRDALTSPAASRHGDEQRTSFEQWLAHGNPWRTTALRRRQSTRQAGGAGGGATPGVRSPGHNGPAGAAAALDDYGLPIANGQAGDAGSVDGGGSSGGDDDDDDDGDVVSEPEAEELYADYIDEDSQRPVFKTERGGSGSTARGGAAGGADGPAGASGWGDGGGGGSAGQLVGMTNSSWRAVKWMRDYAELMRSLRPTALSVFSGMCQLFELYLLHVFSTFSDVTVAKLLAAAAGQHSGAASIRPDAATPRLQGTLVRIVTDSLSRYPQLLASQRGVPSDPAAFMAGSGGAPGSASAMGSAFQHFKEKHLGPSTVVGGGAAAASGTGVAGRANTERAAPAAASARAAAAAGGGPSKRVSYSGNLYGLRERTVAVESLVALAAELKRARAALQSLLPPSEASALDQFFQRTVGAADDVRECTLRSGARLNLPLGWVPEVIAACNYVLAEPPTKHQPWVDQVLGASRMFRDRLNAVDGLGHDTIEQLWDHAVQYVCEAMLDGISRVKRCTLEGRAAMAVDLQTLTRGLQKTAPPGTTINMRVVDNYIKGFYIPPSELRHWAQTHPEFTHAQLLALAGLVAEAAGFKRRDRLSLLQAVEADLKSLEGPGYIT